MAPIYKIHPAIGIARLGTSLESFPGPTIPGVFTPPQQYRDSTAEKKLKRQAVTFWVYQYDEANPSAEPIKVKVGPQEDVKRIEWTVHVANKKSAWFNFDGLVGANGILNPPNFGYPAGSLRNPAGSRSAWTINPGPRTADTPGQRVEFRKGGSQGSFPETWPAPLQNGNSAGIETLGEMRVEADCGLTVLGAFGNSGSIDGSDIVTYANNPGWFDDTADGFVKAQLVMKNDSTQEASPAWVIVGPPDFAPPIDNIVTLYDAIYDIGLRFCALASTIFDPQANHFVANFQPSFEKHIYPILVRAYQYRWVYDNNDLPLSPSFHNLLAGIDQLGQPPTSSGSDPNAGLRSTVFHRLRNPNSGEPNNVPGNMPFLHSDLGDGAAGRLKMPLTITQFEMMRRWSTGHFTRGTAPLPPATPTQITVAGLDRSQIESAVGGAFFPGIECGWIVREPRLYTSPFEFRFRLAASGDDVSGLSPGDVTKRSACPWQADFMDCANNWWPAQRPNQVRRLAANSDFVDWVDGLNSEIDMVRSWHALGILVSDASSTPPIYYESERNLPRP